MLKLPKPVHVLMHYAGYLYQRAKHDRLPVNAGYMTYITLLSSGAPNHGCLDRFV